jgi:hypothetical protein
MIPREIRPGVFILVSEQEAWDELMTGRRPCVQESSRSVVIEPGSDVLCLVEDQSVRGEDCAGQGSLLL